MAPSANDEGVTGGGAGDNQDPRITVKLAETLPQAPILFDRLTATSRAGGMPRSEYAKDESSALGHHVRILAIDPLTTGIEHLVIWNRLLADERPPGGRADRHDPLLGALAHDMERPVGTDVADPQRGELGQSEAGVEQDEREGPLALVGEGEEAPQLRVGERGR